MNTEENSRVTKVPTDGRAGTSDASWLEIVEHKKCAGCGFEAAAVPRHQLGHELQLAAQSWASFLENTGSEALRQHVVAGVWSPLEYAVHVRDVLQVFAQRIELMLREDEPDLGWWDHEEAIRDGSANRSDPSEIGQNIVANATHLAELVDFDESANASNVWARRGTRRGTEVFTIESKIRFALHEMLHHLADARHGSNP
ncbi:MAG: DinB family protein [Acidimicrobiia bacterium]